MELKFLDPHTPKTNQYSALNQRIHKKNSGQLMRRFLSFRGATENEVRSWPGLTFDGSKLDDYYKLLQCINLSPNKIFRSTSDRLWNTVFNS